MDFTISCYHLTSSGQTRLSRRRVVVTTTRHRRDASVDISTSSNHYNTLPPGNGCALAWSRPPWRRCTPNNNEQRLSCKEPAPLQHRVPRPPLLPACMAYLSCLLSLCRHPWGILTE